jgi:hypothetical protein
MCDTDSFHECSNVATNHESVPSAPRTTVVMRRQQERRSKCVGTYLMDVGGGKGESRTIIRGGGCSRSTNPNPEAVGMVSLRLYTVKCCHRVVGVLDPKGSPTPVVVSVRGSRQRVCNHAYVTYDVGGEDVVKYDRHLRKHSAQYAFTKNVF